MTSPADQIVLAAYYGLLLVLCAYSVYRVRLVFAGRRRSADLSPRTATDPASCPPLTEPFAPASPAAPAVPFVTVQLPIYNEPRVAARLIEAASRLDYPTSRFEIQILDDSDDEFATEVANSAQLARRRGANIIHLRRNHRDGYKAGALAHGQTQARGDLIAIFDADFLPGADFLKQTVPYFADPQLGMVQARWGHLNRGSSLLARVQALWLDVHFEIEQRARSLRQRFLNFNGTAGVWRRAAIEDAGGWQHDTLTEDLDLSYRAQLRGWRFRYLSHVVVPAELPARLSSFRSQQRRWTLGSIQTLRKLGLLVVRSRFPLATRVEALVHLAGNLVYPILLTLGLLLPFALGAQTRSSWAPFPSLDVTLLLIGCGSLALSSAIAARRAGHSASAAVALLPLAICLGMGMALHNTRAALRGIVQHGGEFVRTPKLALADGAPSPASAAARTEAGPRLFLGEALIVLYLSVATVLLTSLLIPVSFVFLTLFAIGNAWVAFGDFTLPASVL